MTALYTAPAGIFLVDRRSGEVTPLATRGHTDIGDAPRRGAIIADLEESDFLVYRTQTPLTCHHTVVLLNDGVTGLVSEREIGQIVKAAEHRAALKHNHRPSGLARRVRLPPGRVEALRRGVAEPLRPVSVRRAVSGPRWARRGPAPE